MVILGRKYLKAADVENGDTITFKDEGEWVESTMWKYEDGNAKVDFIIKIDYKGEEKSMRLNKTNRDIVTEAYGNDTAEWVGKMATINKEKVMVAGKKLDCIELSIDKDAAGVNQDDVPF